MIHGTKILQESFHRRQGRNEEAQRRHAEERPFRQEGEEQEAGNRDRAFRGAGQGQEGAEEGRQTEDGEEAEGEEKGSEKVGRPTSVISRQGRVSPAHPRLCCKQKRKSW